MNFSQMIDGQIASIKQNPKTPFKMSVEIIQVTDRQLTVNGKTIIKDMDDMWKHLQELTNTEVKFLGEYLIAMEMVSAPFNATFKV
jgi:hypothetical protein